LILQLLLSNTWYYIIQLAIHDTATGITLNLPDLHKPEVGEEDMDWLFDSRRDYFEQLGAY